MHIAETLLKVVESWANCNRFPSRGDDLADSWLAEATPGLSSSTARQESSNASFTVPFPTSFCRYGLVYSFLVVTLPYEPPGHDEVEIKIVDILKLLTVLAVL